MKDEDAKPRNQGIVLYFWYDVSNVKGIVAKVFNIAFPV